MKNTENTQALVPLNKAELIHIEVLRRLRNQRESASGKMKISPENRNLSAAWSK